jgi:raffinose/stachyose/melibiose transport system substrate-binding protein
MARVAVVALAGAVFALGVGASEARPARSDQITLSMFALGSYQMGWNVLIANFERAYPNITVNITYGASGALGTEELAQLGAGTAPDLLNMNLGCAGDLSVCALARAGDVAPMIDAPWTKRSLPLLISMAKYHQALYAFDPQVQLHGVFTNDGLFAKLGLKVPQTFSQLLAVCQKAHAGGTVAMILDGASSTSVDLMIQGLATPTVYGQATHWTAASTASKLTVPGSAAWRQAFQEFVEMNTAGCFQPGVAGTSQASAFAEFAQGQGLMTVGTDSFKSEIDGAKPAFSYTFHQFPAATAPGQLETYLHPGPVVGVNAHSSAQNQAGAQTFVTFIARPKEDALFTEITGGLTQYELLKDQIPPFMSDFTTVAKDHEYVLQPLLALGNANVQTAFDTDVVGLLTGQETPDSILQAMDAAWKQPS